MLVGGRSEKVSNALPPRLRNPVTLRKSEISETSSHIAHYAPSAMTIKPFNSIASYGAVANRDLLVLLFIDHWQFGTQQFHHHHLATIPLHIYNCQNRLVHQWCNHQDNLGKHTSCPLHRYLFPDMF